MLSIPISYYSNSIDGIKFSSFQFYRNEFLRCIEILEIHEIQY